MPQERPVPGDDEKTYTQAEFDAAIAERVAEDAGALKRALDAEKAAAKQAKAEARALSVRVAEFETQVKASKAGVTSEELERLRHEVKADLEKQFAPVLTEAETLKVENRRLKLDDRVKAEMAKHGARAERIEALYKLTRDEFDLTEDGQPMLKSRPGTEVSKFVAEELAAQYPEFYQGTGSSGGGASKSIAGGAGATRFIAAGDDKAFLANLEGIATGKVEVR